MAGIIFKPPYNRPLQIHTPDRSANMSPEIRSAKTAHQKDSIEETYGFYQKKDGPPPSEQNILLEKRLLETGESKSMIHIDIQTSSQELKGVVLDTSDPKPDDNFKRTQKTQKTGQTGTDITISKTPTTTRNTKSTASMLFKWFDKRDDETEKESPKKKKNLKTGKALTKKAKSKYREHALYRNMCVFFPDDYMKQRWDLYIIL